jgi:hypothetical protein
MQQTQMRWQDGAGTDGAEEETYQRARERRVGQKWWRRKEGRGKWVGSVQIM